MRKLFVDDERLPPFEDWEIARTYADAIVKLATYEYNVLSVDHDLGDFDSAGKEWTGYDIALWLANRKSNGGYVPPDVRVHSMNSVGAPRIQGVIDRYLKDAV